MITYQLMNREPKPWGIDLTTRFGDDETGTTVFRTFRFDGKPTKSEIVERMNHAVYNIGFDLNPINDFDFGKNTKDVLTSLVKHVRNHPDSTVTQLESVVKTAYPDTPWKANKLIDHIKNEFDQRRGRFSTFIQFKTYLVEHLFEAVD
jgi:hypothetical protein